MAKAAKHQANGTVDHGVKTIGKRDVDIRAETCCADKNLRLLSTTGQLCDIKGFQNAYEAITNVPVGIAATELFHDDGTVYILI